MKNLARSFFVCILFFVPVLARAQTPEPQPLKEALQTMIKEVRGKSVFPPSTTFTKRESLPHIFTVFRISFQPATLQFIADPTNPTAIPRRDQYYVPTFNLTMTWIKFERRQ
jgi:hypothetical protein